MTLARAIADDRQAIIREIDRRLADPVNRRIFGFVALEQFRLWLLARPEEKKENL